MDTFSNEVIIGFFIGFLLGGVIGWRTGGERGMGCLGAIGSLIGIFAGMAVYANSNQTDVSFMPMVGAILGFFGLVPFTVMISSIIDTKRGIFSYKTYEILDGGIGCAGVFLSLFGAYLGYQIGQSGWQPTIFSIGPWGGAILGILVGMLIWILLPLGLSHWVEPEKWKEIFQSVAGWLGFYLVADCTLIGYQSLLKDWSQPIKPGFGILIGFLVGVMMGLVVLVASSRRVHSTRAYDLLKRVSVWLIFFSGVFGASIGYGLHV